jgi:hypothetical protein
MTKPRMLLYALGIAAAAVLLTRLGFTLALGRPLRFYPAVDVTQAMIVVIPFVVLTMGNISDRAPWRTGLVLTFLLWGYALFDGIRAQASGNVNPNETLGLLLLASPIIISIACIAVYAIGRRAR